MPNRRNKKTEIKRLKEENDKLRKWNSGWQIAYDSLWKEYMELVDKFHGNARTRKPDDQGASPCVKTTAASTSGASTPKTPSTASGA